MPVNIPRFLGQPVLIALENVPALAILGPRQCGKTTLARDLIANFPNVLYLDLRGARVSPLQDFLETPDNHDIFL